MLNYTYGNKVAKFKTTNTERLVYIGHDNSIKTYTPVSESGITTALADFVFYKYVPSADVTVNKVSMYCVSNDFSGGNNKSFFILDNTYKKLLRAGYDSGGTIGSFVSEPVELNKKDGTVMNGYKVTVTPAVTDTGTKTLVAGETYWFSLSFPYTSSKANARTYFIDGTNDSACVSFNGQEWRMMVSNGTEIPSGEMTTAETCPQIYIEIT